MEKTDVIVVVAHFCENLDWIKTIDLPTWIYVKGTKPEKLPAHAKIVEELPNVGREPHTFCHYVLENYDNLPDYTILLQGDPLDHIKRPLNEYLHQLLDTMRMEGGGDIKSEYEPVYDDVHYCNGTGHPSHPGLPLGKAYTSLLGQDPPETFYFPRGGQFIVSRERIRTCTPTFWTILRDVLGREQNPTMAFIMERLWGYILGDAAQMERIYRKYFGKTHGS